MVSDRRKYESDAPRPFPLETTAAIGGPHASERARTLPGPPTSILLMSSSSSSRMLRMRIVESSHPIASWDDAREAARAKMGGSVGRVDWKLSTRAPPGRKTYLDATNLFP